MPLCGWFLCVQLHLLCLSNLYALAGLGFFFVSFFFLKDLYIFKFEDLSFIKNVSGHAEHRFSKFIQSSDFVKCVYRIRKTTFLRNVFDLLMERFYTGLKCAHLRLSLKRIHP